MARIGGKRRKHRVAVKVGRGGRFHPRRGGSVPLSPEYWVPSDQPENRQKRRRRERAEAKIDSATERALKIINRRKSGGNGAERAENGPPADFGPQTALEAETGPDGPHTGAQAHSQEK